MRRRCVTVQRKGSYSRQEIAAAAVELRESAGGPTALAFAFITPDYAPYLEEFAEMVRVDGRDWRGTDQRRRGERRWWRLYFVGPCRR